MRKAVVVFSGGQDSTTCLFWALEKFDEVFLVSFNYGQRNISELECAKKIAKDLGLPHDILDLGLMNSLTANAMTRGDIAIEAGTDGAPPTTFVDGRNMVFLTYAAIYAKARGAANIVTGVCETDFSGYPDCRDIFVKSLNVTLNLAMDYPFVIHTPLMWLTKEQEWEMADRMGRLEYIKNNTLTCYNNIPGGGCGECPSCLLRKRGYEAYIERKGNV